MLDDIATYLAAQSTAFTVFSGTAGDLSKAFMPSTGVPDTFASLFDTPGTATSFEFSTGASPSVLYEQPSLQLLSRSSSAQTAKTRARTAYTILDGITNTKLPTSTGTLYIDIVADQPPFLVGRDANQRFQYSVNFTVRVER